MSKSKKIDQSKLKLPAKADVNKTKATAPAADQAIDKIHPTAPSANGDKEETVRFTLDIPKGLHKEMKLRTFSLPSEPSLKDYILDLVKKDLAKK